MRTSLRSAFVVAAAAVWCLAPFGAAGADGAPPVSVSAPTVAPGSQFTVSGSGCAADAQVFVGLLDADEESALVADAVPGGGAAGWSITVAVPASVRPGQYPLSARCSSYSGGAYAGYAGYDGYDGGAFEYPPASVTVLPPASAPAADGPLTVTPNVLPAGTAAAVSGSGWRPGEQVTVVLYSSPALLGAVRADDTGAISTRVTIPAGTPLGAHQVVAMNATSAVNPPRTLAAPITVSAATTATEDTGAQVQGISTTAGSQQGGLAYTGTEPLPLVILGVLALLAGGALLVWLRRRPATA